MSETAFSLQLTLTNHKKDLLHGSICLMRNARMASEIMANQIMVSEIIPRM